MVVQALLLMTVFAVVVVLLAMGYACTEELEPPH